MFYILSTFKSHSYVFLNGLLDKRWSKWAKRYWNNNDCSSLDARQLNLVGCQEECLSTESCTAFNIYKDGKSPRCDLRNCGSNVTKPSGGPDEDYTGYFLSPGIIKKDKGINIDSIR